ncbi:MAG: hypothetical protein QM473_17490 [Acidobacteriota bacterium]|nr:hypothetical protein [Acidobacteriota bacterium]
MPARILLLATVVLAMCAQLSAQEPVNIGSRLELLVDDALIERMDGEVRFVLHQPVRREIVLRTDAPWEGNASAFQSVFKDGDLYRMYYRGLHYLHSGEPAQAMADHPWFLCYAESDDGINWRRPVVGRFEFSGSTENNIILTPEFLSEIGGDPAHTAAFKDENPDCPPEERYKIIVVGHKPTGLYVLASPDGIHFEILSKEPITTTGAFDSQNLAFWDPYIKQYREYHRGFRDGVRDIMTAASPDIRKFPEPEWLRWPDAPKEHLYTNAIQPYYRAPHILVGFPMRYTDRGWSKSILDLPGLDERVIRAKSHPRYGTAITDGLFMSSRDGLTFKRWPEAFIRPGPRDRESWVYGDNFIFWGMVETESATEDAPDELSLYATESYWEGIGSAVRRYTLRVDGFVSAQATLKGGEIVTKPLIFEGGNLAINAETSGAGGVQVEIQDADGSPIDGYTLDECMPILCDDLRHIVRWDYEGGDLSRLAGTPVRLRFVLSDADLYSFQFVPLEPEPEYPDTVQLGAMPRKNRDREPFVALQDDFQADMAGTGVEDGDLDPVATSDGTGWFITEGSPDRVQVLNDDPVGGGQAGERQYLKVQRLAETHMEGGLAWVRLSPQDAADTTRGMLEVRTRIYVPSSNKGRVEIDGYDNPPGEFSRRAFHVRIASDGAVTYFRETENPVDGLRVEPDTWQDVRICAYLDRGVFDLTIGATTVQGLPFALDGVRRIQTVLFGPNNANCTLYVDEVCVSVEP